MVLLRHAAFSAMVAAAALGTAAVVPAGPAYATEKLEEKSKPLGKALPYLEDYLRLPAAERQNFTMAYYFLQDGKPSAAVSVWIVDGTARTPVPLSADGRLKQLPSLAQFERGKLVVQRPDKTKVELRMSVEPLLAPAQELDAARLAAAVAEADAGSKKLAGLFSFAAPDMEGVTFKGVTSGEVVWADGTVTPLPKRKGAPQFVPSTTRKAAKIRLAGVPTRMIIGPAE